MSQENGKMSDQDLEDFLGEITSDKSQPRVRLNKLTMTARTNKGTVMFVPIQEAKNKRYYYKIPYVREVKMPTELNDRVDEAYHKILPKEFYKFEDASQEKLYDEVSDYFDRLYDSGVWQDGLERSANYARIRTYVLFFGYVLSHTDEVKKPLTDNINKPALLIYPTNKVIDALGAAIDQKKQASNGNVAFVNRYFNASPIGRVGALVITTSGGQGGYNIQLSFESNSEDNPYLIPKDLDLTESMKLCQDYLDSFLGWQGDEESGYFNKALFLEMREWLAGYFDESGNIDPQYLVPESEEENKPNESADPLA